MAREYVLQGGDGVISVTANVVQQFKSALLAVPQLATLARYPSSLPWPPGADVPGVWLCAKHAERAAEPLRVQWEAAARA